MPFLQKRLLYFLLVHVVQNLGPLLWAIRTLYIQGTYCYTRHLRPPKKIEKNRH